MADVWEVAHHLARCLDAVKVVGTVKVCPQDFGPALIGTSPHGQFYIQLWPTPEDTLKGVQAISMPPEGRTLHLGFWQPLGGVEGTVQQVVTALWNELVKQDKENRELERATWVPVANLPSLQYEAAPARLNPTARGDLGVPDVPEVPEVPEVSTSEPEESAGVLDMFGV